MALTWNMKFTRDSQGRATKVVGTTKVNSRPASMEITRKRVRLSIEGTISAATPERLAEFAQVAANMQNDMEAQFARGGAPLPG